MSLFLKINRLDLTNLFLAKGANFLLTAIIFGMISREMDANSFGEFGYWWSIAVMFGGIFLGGFFTAVVRFAVLEKSIIGLKKQLNHAAGLLISCIVAMSLLAFASSNQIVWLLASASLFGIAIQLQAALPAMLRAIEVGWGNLFATFIILIVTPTIFILLDPIPNGLPFVFGALSLSFAAGTTAAFAFSLPKLKYLLEPSKNPSYGFSSDFISFVVINIFSYAIINIDFTIFRILGTTEDFSEMALIKIFFERFALPLLLVFSGAISMHILRHPRQNTRARVQINIQSIFLVTCILIFSAITIASIYWFFSNTYQSEVIAVNFPWILCASIGYLLYSINGIFFDALVVRSSYRLILFRISLLLFIHTVLQYFCITLFGIEGWAAGWMLFNIFVFVFFAHKEVQLFKVDSNAMKQ